jgi:dTDP-4-dehydrorhamnose reductase
MKKKILIFGNGFIGNRLRDELGYELSGRMVYKLDDIQEEIDRVKPGVIINCIGYTGKNNVDDCESDRDGTLSANTFVPLMLAEAALRNNIKLVHISSGCIYRYDYKKQAPITEKDIPDFFGLFYSRTKIYAERALDVLSGRYGGLIVRIRIPLDNRPLPKNILTKLINYKTVIDIPNSVTYIPDFIAALRHLIKINARGIFNVVNRTPLRYPQLLDVYKKYNPGFEYTMIKPGKLQLVRTNLILSTKKLEQSGFKMPRIEDVLEECVRNYVGVK